eukprot:XP_011675337.1 PREDICTED: exosome complex exonuclease RRP42 [Strongylocentrotus purpuratus]
MDGTEDIDVSSNPHDFVTLDTKNLPVLVTVTTVGSGHIVDATLEEEACSMACIVAAVNKEGAIDGMVKKGSGSLTIDSIYKMLTSAKQIGKDENKSWDDFSQRKESLENLAVMTQDILCSRTVESRGPCPFLYFTLDFGNEIMNF